ncbi:hypothetical protein EYC84_004625 [Monilinia fructicola]|uniref:Uncharacterized protein n=1 Tax=Monilinia fructicola TaxID=38448 RepID=A0A5M9K1S2_MONFR|nr:hypothetical protein EYC84_004625 [Monilinia fructicola]
MGWDATILIDANELLDYLMLDMNLWMDLWTDYRLEDRLFRLWIDYGSWVPPQQPIRQPEIYIHHHRYPFIHRQSINLHQVKHFLPWAFVKIEIHQTPR